MTKPTFTQLRYMDSRIFTNEHDARNCFRIWQSGFSAGTDVRMFVRDVRAGGVHETAWVVVARGPKLGRPESGF